MSGIVDARILIVEDEPIIAMMLEDLLAAAGATVVGPAHDVASALAAVESASLDAAILDVNLNGETSDAIAAVLQTRGIPFALATGYERPLTADGPPVIQKPYQDQRVLDAVADMVARRG